MPASATLLPSRRAELVIKPFGDNGQYVVKDPHTSEFFHIGAEEHFLLMQLDGKKEAGEICAAFTQELGQPLSEEELADFVEMARQQGFLQELEETPSTTEISPAIPDKGESNHPLPISEDKEPQRRENGTATHQPKPKRKKHRQSILYWRKSLFDPDRLMNWLEPKIPFFWTSGFLVVSALCIMAAVGIMWTSREQAVSSFARSLRWETFYWVWLTIFAVTMLHEFAHGLTCKHYGGEVHEIGFLLLFFMPCFYCNVSDAWLFREKSKRLWVTFAGGYFELFLWALAVFVWRLTVPESMIHYLAFVVVTSCGIQSLFNFNPLIKLDGYYLLSDWLEVPNLRQRARDYFAARCRWLLWGAKRPPRENRGHVLLLYGVVSFAFSLFFVSVMLLSLANFAYHYLGWVGLILIGSLGLVTTRGMLSGFSKGEVRQMFLLRHKRLICWLLIVAALIALLVLVPIEDHAGGTLLVRADARAEIRAPVAGFLKEIRCEEGDRISYGNVLFRLEIPDLESRLAQKRAEIKEAEAKLKLLLIGPRPEEIREQRERVKRAAERLALSQEHLQREQKAFEQERKRLEHKIAEHQAEVATAKAAYQRATILRSKNAFAEEDYAKAKRKWQVSQAQLQQASAEKNAYLAKGTLAAEQEVAKRNKEAAEAQATLSLLLAGSRPEEIEAQRATCTRLQAEAHYLEQLQQKLAVASPISGVVTTPRLREKIGQYVHEGNLIAVVEESAVAKAEISLDEQDAARLQLDQEVALKVQAFPFETFSAKVKHISPSIREEDDKKTVLVECLLKNGDGKLRPGMTGYGRVYTGSRVIGEILLYRVLRYVRTEFWW